MQTQGFFGQDATNGKLDEGQARDYLRRRHPKTCALSEVRLKQGAAQEEEVAREEALRWLNSRNSASGTLQTR